MDIKLGLNILKCRKRDQVTQMQLAEYLNVSPQAISKWEQGASMPDISLLPKIAFFFNTSIDSLFGSSSIENVTMLVEKYVAVKSDKNYENAKDAITNLSCRDQDNLEVLAQLAQLELQRVYDAIGKTLDACESLEKASEGIHPSWNKRAKVEKIRIDAMLGNHSMIDFYSKRFVENRVVDDFNYMLIALRHLKRFQDILDMGEQEINTFSHDEQLMVYPNLLDAAVEIQDFQMAQDYFNKIKTLSKDKHQLFNAWFLMWELMKKVEHPKTEDYRNELKKQLLSLDMNKFAMESLKHYINGAGLKPVRAL